MRRISEIVKSFIVTQRVLKKLSLNENKTIFAWNHIGDLCIVFSMLGKYDYDNEVINIVISEKFKDFSKNYCRANRHFIYLKDYEVNCLMYSARFNVTKPIFNRYSNLIITDPWYYLPEEIGKMKSFSLLSFYRDCIFDYRGDLIYPNFEEKEIAICSEKYIIISPYAGSMETIASNDWEKIVESANAKGYRVFCNLAQGQTSIKGAEPLYCKLDELFGFCKFASLFIGLRSGVMDFIISSGVKIIAIYNGKYQYMYNLKSWNTDNVLCELDYNSCDIINEINDIIQ